MFLYGAPRETRTLTLAHWLLRPACLPVPPSGQCLSNNVKERYAVLFNSICILYLLTAAVSTRSGHIRKYFLVPRTRIELVIIAYQATVIPFNYPSKSLGEPKPLAFPYLSRLRCSVGSNLVGAVRFELTDPFGSSVFKTGAINRTLPHFRNLWCP